MPSPQELEDRRWNRMAETMASFHGYFKQEFDTIYELADGSFTKRGLSLSLYLEMAKRLNSHLTMHHTMEERHIFPILAKRMPEAQTEAGHIDSHKGIHKGLDELSTLVHNFKKEPSTYSPAQMRACLDGFREVLFSHLDEEVNDLRGENLKKYWTLEELESIPM
ncbi:hemerythrin HHE cation binding domain-containing protein [Mycena sp. CBHHK59/15]|nr:hemerythrin HHE cation binding domain-containing protein [Mycena sp. CBHHK59/15]